MGQVTIFCTTYYSTTKTHGTRIEVVKSVTSLTPPAAYIYMFSPRFQAARSWALALSRAEWLPEEFQTDQIAQCHRSHGHAELGGRLYCCWRALVQVSCGSKALRWTRKELQLQKTKHQLVDILLTSTKSSSFQDFSLDKTKKIICPLVRIQEYTAQSSQENSFKIIVPPLCRLMAFRINNSYCNKPHISAIDPTETPTQIHTVPTYRLSRNLETRKATVDGSKNPANAPFDMVNIPWFTTGFIYTSQVLSRI